MDACHRYGIYVTEHHSAVIMFRTETPEREALMLKRFSKRNSSPAHWPGFLESAQRDVIVDGSNISDMAQVNPVIGKRLALLALAKELKKDVVFSGPLYKDMKIEGNKIRISFDSFGSGLMIGEKTGLDPVREIKGGKVKWISISGKDNKWYWADMAIDGNTIVVFSDKVPEPLAVRYAYTMNPIGPMLYNKEGLPASPFTTEAAWQ